MSGWDTEFEGQVVVHNIDATTPPAPDAVTSLEFNNHGLVIYGADKEVLFKQPDHEVNVDEVRAKVVELLAQ